MEKIYWLSLHPRFAAFHEGSLPCKTDDTPGARVEVGHELMEALFFEGDTLTAHALERAIEWTEDRIQAARLQLAAGAPLYSDGAELQELAMVCGVSEGSGRTVHVDAVEHAFSRLVLQALGQIPPPEALPATARFFSTVVVMRELMHHLSLPKLIVLNDAGECAAARSQMRR